MALRIPARTRTTTRTRRVPTWAVVAALILAAYIVILLTVDLPGESAAPGLEDWQGGGVHYFDTGGEP